MKILNMPCWRRLQHPPSPAFTSGPNQAAEKAGAADHPDRLLAGLTGKVIELGAGNGLNVRKRLRSTGGLGWADRSS